MTQYSDGRKIKNFVTLHRKNIGHNNIKLRY